MPATSAACGSAQPEGQPEVFVRVGRYGPFLEQGDRRASIPEQTPPDEIDARNRPDDAGYFEAKRGAAGPRSRGQADLLKVGRFGPYVQLRNTRRRRKAAEPLAAEGHACREDVTIDVALQALSLPRTLGRNHPQTASRSWPSTAIRAVHPLWRRAKARRRARLPAGVSPLDVTLEQALELSGPAQGQGRGRGAAKREPLKVFEASPVTNNPVHLLSGSYGPYVTDGVTNATFPRGTAPEEVTLEYALNLLKVRAEQGPSERQLMKAAKKAAAEKKAAPKKAVKKAKKKSPKKPTDDAE